MQTNNPNSHSPNAQGNLFSPRSWGVFGFIAFIVVMIWAIVSKQPLSTFIDSGSWAIVFGGTAALLFATHGWWGVRNAFSAIFVEPINDSNRHAATSFFRSAATFALACGFLGMLIGMVVMLANMNDPSKIGPALAFCLLTQIYGVFIAVISLAATGIVGHNAGERHAFEQTISHSVPVAGAGAAVGTLTVLFLFVFLGSTIG